MYNGAHNQKELEKIKSELANRPLQSSTKQ